MSTTEWPQPGGGILQPGEPEGGARRRRRIKLLIVLMLLAGLAWVIMLGVQYFLTKQSITELPGMPPVVGVSKKPEANYSGSLYGVQRPLGVAVGADGSVYVTESGGERKVHVFNQAGQEILSFAPPGTQTLSRVPVYVAVSPKGGVYVSDRDAATIYIFSPDGALQGTVASPVAGGWAPLGLSFDKKGNLYVTDVTPDNHRILVLDPEGKLLRQFGKEGKADGEFWFPNGVAIDKQGRIYVSDSNNGRVQIFDSAGNLLYKISRGMGRGDLSLPRGIGLDDDNRLFVVDTSAQEVKVYDVSKLPKLKLLSTFGEEGSSEGTFEFPNGLALDGAGRIYVTDRENNRVQIWRQR